MEATALPQQLVSPALSKKVSFVEAPGGEEGACKSSPDGKAAAAAVAGADCSELPLSHHTNALFSPERAEGGWTIGAQRSDQMEGPEAAAGGEPLASPSPLASLGAASGAAYTPASSTWLESTRKVNDLQGRLASLEAALKDMESKVGHWAGAAGAACACECPGRAAVGRSRPLVAESLASPAEHLLHSLPCAAHGNCAPAGRGTPGQEPAGEGAGHGGQDRAKALPGGQGAGPQAAAPNPAGRLRGRLKCSECSVVLLAAAVMYA